jgi:succinate dehydrogenase hydrophobic anchor subunit
LIYISGYILVTHVWFVTEKTISHAESEYNDEVQTTLWPRMISRGAFLTLLLAVATFGAGIAIAATLQLPYSRGTQWRRALFTDLLVAAVGTVFISLAVSSV